MTVEGDDEPIPPPTGWKPLKLELEEYLHYLDDTNLTVEQKTAFLEALWLLIGDLVSVEFGTHPVQAARAARNE